MPRKFTATVCLSVSLGGETELPLIATVRFTHCPARAATPPSYASGGVPPEDEGVEDEEVIDLVVDGTVEETLTSIDRPQWLCDWIVENVDTSILLEAVDYGPDPDEARERQRDDAMDRREDARMWGAEE